MRSLDRLQKNPLKSRIPRRRLRGKLMFRRTVSSVLAAAVVLVASTRHPSGHHHRRPLAHHAPKSLHLLLPVSPNSVSVLLSDLEDGLRSKCIETIEEGKEAVLAFRVYPDAQRLSSVAGPSDGNSAKRSKHKRRCRLWMDDEKVALVGSDCTFRILEPVFSNPSYRLSVPLPSSGSGSCHSLPRAREDLIPHSLPSGAQTV